ncbi:malonyl-CoA decarboxylase [Halomonas cupida]|uniref:malonyl-CoA decarboxylase n=1 Tax=Halomonas TaxID=2745 RepID=UPI001C98536B|nr:malonyl-CoA decarboxylase [Halomonas sp. DP8Y7-1]MBY6028413.1 malonyl-CoA decarboxylase [Halomonas sp. DP8Y7-1]MED5296489.1 malonyl-CoA decarboxylase [Pseudomonadota bacterium]
MNFSFLQELLSNITQRDALLRRRSDGPPLDHSQVIDACHRLLASDGEASSITLACQALDAYGRLGDAEKTRFFLTLTEEFTADPDAVDRAYQDYRVERGNMALQRLFEACEPKRQELLRRLNLTTGGTHDLVRMREDLLPRLKDNPDLRALDDDFAHLFASWFNRGFLVLKRIDWNTPAAVLEKIIRYEAVHEICDWNDLRRRLDARDRRCFAFFHPAIGDEPLIFVEVALTKGMPDRIQPILDANHEAIEAEDADSAAFFGISNCQVGLRGISFGNFLIKQVVQELKAELPRLKHFVTLSPVPGFRAWLDAERQREDGRLDDDTQTLLKELDSEGWEADPERAKTLGEAIRPLAAHYLTKERNPKGLPLNSVARFHLGNGAELHRINWLGDTSRRGLAQFGGLMVNYLYVLDDIEGNHERYSSEGKVACSSQVKDLRRRARKHLKGDPVT